MKYIRYPKFKMFCLSKKSEAAHQVRRSIRIVLLCLLFLCCAKASWGVPLLVISGDENGFNSLLGSDSLEMRTTSRGANRQAVWGWKYSRSSGENFYQDYLDLIGRDPFLNQGRHFLSPMDAAKRRWAITPDTRAFLLIDTFAYEPDSHKRPDWQRTLMEKVAEAVFAGGTAFISGKAWPFAAFLADKGGVGLRFQAVPSFSMASQVINARVAPKLARIIGDRGHKVVVSPGAYYPQVLLYNQGRTLVDGNIGGSTIPLAMEFPVGKGRVVYMSFSALPNLSRSAPPEARRLTRELVAHFLKERMKWDETRFIGDGIDAGALDVDGADMQELFFCLGRRLEIQCNLKGEVSCIVFSHSSQPSTFGLEITPMPSEAARVLDVSLYSPDGNLFERKKINGEKITFNIPSSLRKVDVNETWSAQIEQTDGHSARALFMGIFVANSPTVDVGETGSDPEAWKAPLNLIYSDQPNPILKGASNPASVDIFIGKGGRTTYIGGTGDNIYTWETMGGHYTIVNGAGRSAASGVLTIGEQAEFTETKISRNGENLVITLRDEQKQIIGSVTVIEWYTRPSAKLQVVSFIGRHDFQTDEIDAWAYHEGLLK